MIPFILQHSLFSLLSLGLFLELFYLKPKKLSGALILTFIPTSILMVWLFIRFPTAYAIQDTSFGLAFVKKLADQISHNTYSDIFQLVTSWLPKIDSPLSWFPFSLISFLFASVLMLGSYDEAKPKDFNFFTRFFTFILLFFKSALGIVIFTLVFGVFYLLFGSVFGVSKNVYYQLFGFSVYGFFISFSISWIFQICGRWLLFYNFCVIVISLNPIRFNWSRFSDNIFYFTSSGILEFLEPDKTWKLFTVILVSIMTNYDLIKKYLPFRT
jgi:hypothetical protein